MKTTKMTQQAATELAKLWQKKKTVQKKKKETRITREIFRLKEISH